MKKIKKTGIAILIAVLLLAVTFMDTWIVFRMTAEQTRESGRNQLTAISGELETTINEAKNLTLQTALTIDRVQATGDTEKLKDNINRLKGELVAQNTGVFNVYAAGKGWDYIPDFTDHGDDFVATERNWYTGAIRMQGKPYVTTPYLDAMTGNICYTISVMLPDNDTVVALDYTMENIQQHIAQLYSKGSNHAVIVTDDGIIAGCDDESLIGQQMISVLPDYAGIYSMAKSSTEVVTLKIKANLLYENLFATRSGNGWYLIFSESDWDLYKYSYIQLIVTLVLSLILFTTIIILYVMATRSRKKAENALRSKEEFLQSVGTELREPLKQILDNSDKGRLLDDDRHSEDFSRIHTAGEKLSEMIEQILSYSSIVRAEKHARTQAARKKQKTARKIHRGIRPVVVGFMILVMLISLYTNISSAYSQGNVTMQKQAERYEYQLARWIDTQKSILDMFCSVFSTHPNMLYEYEDTVEYLNQITQQYPEISVSYMTNPELEHTVIMNNGWEPDPDWHVEDRQWYRDLMASESNWIISVPYYDEQTGGYCVTFAEKVYNHVTGEFMGNFGIDFFMDKLVDILGGSYSSTGYAFLVDIDGDIINHPYGSYQMTEDCTTSVSVLPYGKAKTDGESTRLFRDYDGNLKILLATESTVSNFKVYVVSSVWSIYGQVLIYGLICLITFLVCIILVNRFLSDFIRLQEKNQKALQESAETAIATGEAKSRFLAQMSHEIRTPINAVLGMNEMILRSSSDPEILEYSENIQGAGKNLLSIINSILDFSRIEDGKMEILPVRYDVVSLVHNLENTISERAKNKDLDFRVNVDPTLPSALLGDDVRITQVITNLLTNAVKYTETGSVTFSVKSGGREADMLLMDVEVKDTGIGIREEDMDKLFESFERLEENRNRNIEGTGLGMSIVTKLLTMMGSSLKVESTYGKGSTFSFRLKQQILSTEPLGDYAARLKKVTHKKLEGGLLYAPEARILVVDDNAMNRKVARNLLKLCGITPDLASSGQEAIEMIRGNAYQIIFLDHMMPKMDGIETLKKLKEESLIHDGTAVIALTANAIEGAREMYLEAGFDDYLSKPMEVPQLEEKLQMYLPPALITYRTAQDKAQEEAKNDKASRNHTAEKTQKTEGSFMGSQVSHITEVLTRAKKSTGDTREFFGTAEPESSAPAGESAPDPAPSADGLRENDNSGSTEISDDSEILEFFPGMDYDDTEDSVSQPEELGPDYDDTEDSVSQLEELGLNTEEGLNYCGGETAFYLEMVSDYAEEAEERIRELEHFLEEKNLPEYEIHVHALKSASRTIGAGALFEQARVLEFAAKDGKADFVAEEHPKLVKNLRELAAKLKGRS